MRMVDRDCCCEMATLTMDRPPIAEFTPGILDTLSIRPGWLYKNSQSCARLQFEQKSKVSLHVMLFDLGDHS